MNQPLFDEGDTVYLVESASIGSLEAVVIENITSHNGSWVYKLRNPTLRLSPGTTYGDRISLVTNGDVFYQERELCDLCTALNIAKDVLESRLNKINSMLTVHCDVTG